jgi:TatD DNase family protein
VFVDSHTHLDHCRQEPALLIEEAREAGVGIILQVGTDLERSAYSAALAGLHPEVYAVVGFHPHEAGLLDDEGRAGLELLSTALRVVGIGETGFDFYHDRWPHEVQEDAFLYQLDLARRAGLPVVVHTREAAGRTLAVLDRHAGGLTVVMHCFSLPERLEEIAERGYFVSFAGNVTYRNAQALQTAACKVPLESLLLETDAPWLAPAPWRGRPNSPALVADVYDFVASLRGLSVAELAAQVEANVLRAFPRIQAAREAGS